MKAKEEEVEKENNEPRELTGCVDYRDGWTELKNKASQASFFVSADNYAAVARKCA